MKRSTAVPRSIDDCIAAAPPAVRPVLEEIRRIVREEAPEAEEIISYRMPAFRQHGVLLYFAAFQRHIGIFPPVTGDAQLERALAPYRGPKGNLQLPLDRPVPYDLVRRIARLRVRQDREHAKAKAAKRAGAKALRRRR